MLDFFAPNFYFEKYSDITTDFLKKNGIKTLLIDIDNTLAPYEQTDFSEENINWLDSLKSEGIGFAFISNNSNDERIKRFNKKIGAPAYAKSGKPFVKNTVKKALSALDGNKSNTAFLGDQIFTDVLSGKLNGIKTILVPPINDKKSLFFRFKRALERPVLKKYFRDQKKNSDKIQK